MWIIPTLGGDCAWLPGFAAPMVVCGASCGQSRGRSAPALWQFDARELSRLPEVTRVESNGKSVVAHGKDNQVVVAVVTMLVSNGHSFRDLRTEQPNLEDVFMALTGHEMRD